MTSPAIPEKPAGPAGHWLAKKTVDDLMPPKGVVVCVDSSDKIADAFKTLVSHQIQSAPVFDARSKKFTSLVDLSDILAATLLLVENQANGEKLAELLLRCLKDPKQPDPDVSKLLSTENLFKSIEVKDLSNLSEANPFKPVLAGTNLYDCVRHMLTERIHRTPVLEGDGHLSNLISQTSVLYLLYQNRDMWVTLGQRTMNELNVHNINNHPKHLLCVRNDKRAIDAFQLMQKEKLTNIPVLDDDDKLVASISVQDFKEIGHDASRFKLVNEPLMTYLKHAHSNPEQPFFFKLWSSEHPLSFRGTEKFVDVVQRVVKHRQHCIYYVCKENKLMGVVSIADLLKCFLLH
jgi:CBS-domain-containing membrane protein